MIQKINEKNECPYYLTVEFFAGDTPALQSLGGFIEAVGNAQYPCRECTIDKKDLSKISDEAKCNLRTKQGTIDMGIEATDSKKSVCGVKRLTKLMRYEFFDPITMCPQDPMHVILEGIARRLVIDFFKLWIDTGRTTIEELNSRISAFNYGHLSLKGKLQPLRNVDLLKKEITMTAYQMKITLGIFPFLFYDIVDITSKDYK